MLTVLCSEIRFFAKPRNDVTKSLRASVTSPGGFAVRSPFRDFVHLKVLQNAKHFAKPPGVGSKYKNVTAKMTIEEYKDSVINLDGEDQRKIFTQKSYFHGLPFVFNEREDDYYFF